MDRFSETATALVLSFITAASLWSLTLIPPAAVPLTTSTQQATGIVASLA